MTPASLCVVNNRLSYTLGTYFFGFDCIKRISSVRLWRKGGGFCPPMKESHVTLSPKIAQKLSTSKTLDYELRERKVRNPHWRDVAEGRDPRRGSHSGHCQAVWP
jgi:hypothetical protein